MTLPADRELAPKEHIPKDIEPSFSEGSVDRTRRSVLRKLAVGSAALAGSAILPEKWTAPFVEFGALPAHATTSGAVASIIEAVRKEVEPPAPEEVPPAGDPEYAHAEVIKKSGSIMIDGILRSKFVSSKLGPQYGNAIKIIFDSGEELFVPDTAHDVNTSSGRAYRPGGNPAKHKDVPTMEVYADPGSSATSITVYYNG